MSSDPRTWTKSRFEGREIEPWVEDGDTALRITKHYATKFRSLLPRKN